MVEPGHVVGSEAATVPSIDDLIRLIRDLIVPLSGVKRTTVLPGDATRNESVTEHSFTLGVVACALASRIDPELSVGRIAEYALVHDLIEVYAGDVSVWADSSTLALKARHEAEAVARIERNFGEVFPWISDRIRSYELRSDAESRFVYALDKILPHAMILISGQHPVLPTYKAYADRVEVARRKVAADTRLAKYFEGFLVEFDRHPEFFADGVPPSGAVTDPHVDEA
jgi:5'-deoxynucleotidase YfbR-like HD superfamily hydrolase